jgi:hypothetical protein
MLTYSPRHGRRFLGTVADLWRQGLTRWAGQLLETARLGAGKVEYLTDDAGAAGICPRTGDRADDQDLLRRRMIPLELDPHELALSDAALLRHLNRCCALCENREGCLADLALSAADSAGPGQEDWRDYCANVAALEMLMALRSRANTAPKRQLPYVG